MKRRQVYFVASCVAAGVVAFAGVGRTQPRGLLEPPPQPDSTGKLTPLIGTNSYSAVAYSIAIDGKGKKSSMIVSQTYSDGNFRAERNIADVKEDHTTPERIAQSQKLGFDRMVRIVNVADRTTTVMYPRLKSYIVIETHDPFSDEPPPPNVLKTALGKEVIEGHPCVKYRVVLDHASGENEEMLVWEATDLGNAPIKSQFQSDPWTVVTTYRKLSIAKPDPALFHAPPEFTRYDSMKKLMNAAMESRRKSSAKSRGEPPSTVPR